VEKIAQVRLVLAALYDEEQKENHVQQLAFFAPVLEKLRFEKSEPLADVLDMLIDWLDGEDARKEALQVLKKDLSKTKAERQTPGYYCFTAEHFDSLWENGILVEDNGEPGAVLNLSTLKLLMEVVLEWRNSDPAYSGDCDPGRVEKAMFEMSFGLLDNPEVLDNAMEAFAADDGREKQPAEPIPDDGEFYRELDHDDPLNDAISAFSDGAEEAGDEEDEDEDADSWRKTGLDDCQKACQILTGFLVYWRHEITPPLSFP
ncbi:MAG: hypothetical protein U1C97_00395, partial [Candidatus Gracilibacteria bacterium]|nr:hypothetical protein [Candidatus Gracilibacteria bacterium]